MTTNKSMIKQFSLYGFLKNLRFFEPFLILYFLDLGLNFLQIGILVSFRSICINIMEIPSGAVADLYGRKNAMVISLFSYLVSFIIFSFAWNYTLLFITMFLFSMGEAFRTGTHKAMIFDWLRHEERLDERTEVYGYTRSWSKIGSAVSVIISSAVVIISSSYQWVFILSTLPYIAGIINILTYPDYLNKKAIQDWRSIKPVFTHLWNTLKKVLSISELRRLILKGMAFEGIFDVSGDYLQPILKTQALALSGILLLSDNNSTAITVGVVYFILYLISASASRSSHIFLKKSGSESHALKLLIFFSAILLLTASFGIKFSLYIVPIIAFILFHLIQNIWRPILVSIYDTVALNTEQATVLSIESQAKSSGIFLIAPIGGYIADTCGISMTLAFLSGILLLLGFFSRKIDKS